MTYMRAWMSLKVGQIRLLVSMATDRVIVEKKKPCCHFFSDSFIRSFSYLQVMMACMRARRSLNFCQIRLLTAIERLKTPHRLIIEIGVATFSQLFLIGSGSYLQVTMKYIRDWNSSKFGQIR